MLRLNPALPYAPPPTRQHPQGPLPASRLRSGSLSFTIKNHQVPPPSISEEQIEHLLVFFIQKIWSVPSIKELNSTEHEKLKKEIKQLVRYVRSKREDLRTTNNTERSTIIIYSDIYNKLFYVYNEIKKNKKINLTDIAGCFINACGEVKKQVNLA